MERFQEMLKELNVEQLSGLVAPLAVLAFGWLAAVFLSWMVRAMLNRVGFDEAIAARILGAERAKNFDSNRAIARAVYYIAIIFVLIGFFQTLGLTAATEPLNAFLGGLFAFLPRLLAGALLLFTAWVVATILRSVLVRALAKLDFDQRVHEGTDSLNTRAAIPLSQTISDTVYWLTFLLFLPAILGALRLHGLLLPVQGLVDEMLGFLPNLFSAALLLIAGWFVAHIVQRVVTNLLASAGADKLSHKLGVEKALGTWTVSSLAGLVVKVFILIPVAVGALNALHMEALTGPASRMLETVLTTLPALLGAAFIIGLSYLGGRVLAKLISNLLSGVGFDHILIHLGVSKAVADEQRSSPSRIMGGLVLVGVMLFATITAANLLNFDGIAKLLQDFTLLGGRILLGLVIFGLGLYLANLAASTLKSSSMTHAATLSWATRVAILVLAGAMSLRQMGLANEIIELGFGLLLGALAIAVGLAFGLGGREAAARALEEWQDKFSGRGGSARKAS